MALVTGSAECSLMAVVLPMTCDAGRGRRGAPQLILVARMTIERLVRASQHEPCLTIMVKAPELPAVGRMARGTERAKAAFMMRILVAARTRGCSSLVGCGSMAVLAGHRCVQADQGKAREFMIKRDLLAPTGLLVALLAGLTQLAFVWILRLVTSHACLGGLGDLLFAAMATFAAHFSVFSAQSEARRLVVIEGRLLPGLDGVASLAFLAIASGVLVLVGMASDAGSGQPLVAFTDMTGLAAGTGMRS